MCVAVSAFSFQVGKYESILTLIAFLVFLWFHIVDVLEQNASQVSMV
jgi:hypothetical protein